MDTPRIFISHAFDDFSVEYTRALAHELRRLGATIPEVRMEPDSVRYQLEVPGDIPLPENEVPVYGRDLRIAGQDRLEHHRRTRPLQVVVITKRALESRDLERQAEWAAQQYLTSPIQIDPSAKSGIINFYFAVYAEDVPKDLLWPLLNGIDSIARDDEHRNSRRFSSREIIHGVEPAAAARMILHDWLGITTASNLGAVPKRITSDRSQAQQQDSTSYMESFMLGAYEANLHAGRGLLSQGLIERAKEKFLVAIKASDAALEAVYFLAACHYLKGDYGRCAGDLADALGRPNSRNVVLLHCAEALRGLALAAQDRHRDALDAYRCALTHLGTVARTWLLIGRSHLAIEQPGSLLHAQAAFMQANRLDPHMPEALDELAACYFLMHNVTEGRRCRAEADKLHQLYREIGKQDSGIHVIN